MTDMPRQTLMAYPSEICVAPGETIRFMVSEVGTATRYAVRLMRMHSLDEDPDACGLIEEDVPSEFAGNYPARFQAVATGSCIAFPEAAWPGPLSDFTVQAYIWPTRPGAGAATILACWNDDDATGFRLELDANGALALRLGFVEGGEAMVSTKVPLRPREWVLVSASYEAASGHVTVSQAPVRPYPVIDTAATCRETVRGGPLSRGPLPLVIAAYAQGARSDAGFAAHFNGKIDRPRLAAAALAFDDIERLAGTAIPHGLAAKVIGFWDMAQDIGSVRVVDLSAWHRHGAVVNLPTRGMTGFNWTGEFHDWHRAPDQYGAIHFHDDDLYDAGWDADFAWRVPDDTPSGCYAAKLEDGNVPVYLIFFVRPPRRPGQRPPIAFLASTAHFMAYANYRLVDRGPLSETVRGRLWLLGPEDVLMHAHPEIGNSCYDAHSDGSGVCYSSRLRPILNLQPNTRLASLAGDGYVLALLRHLGTDYDIISDEDLHNEGLAALAPYRCLVTGGHPEYWSSEMMEALEGFLSSGGRLMYLGGNGFYWRTTYHRTLPGVIEVRRGEDGNRPWAAEPGETTLSFTGQTGGIWRRLGRPPQSIVGVGYCAEGFDVAIPYHRLPASHDPRCAFIFDGVGDQPIGDMGAGFGGAAGQEIDHYDARLGSPPHALVVATADQFTDNMLLVNEDLEATHLAVGGVECPAVRADMVFFETGYGGAVFSTGSISWVAALACQDFDNPVARITSNVLSRFADPAEFPRVGTSKMDEVTP
jgi:N,N-dimethylformamidase